MRFTYFRSEPRRLHARSPRSSASRGVSAPSALQGPVRNQNRDRDDERGRPLADREPASRWFSSPTKRVASRSTRRKCSRDRGDSRDTRLIANRAEPLRKRKAGLPSKPCPSPGLRQRGGEALAPALAAERASELSPR